MGAALGWGLLAGSSVLLGGLLTLRIRVSARALGLIMGFGSGVLISAVAYELVGEGSTGGRRSRSGSSPAAAPSSPATRSSTEWAAVTASGVFTTIGFALAFAISALE